jgi:predicted HTH domain antitoxin
MEITLEVPESVVKALGYARETLPRRALEALLVEEFARGHLSRGKVAEFLGLSYHETEELLHAHHVPYAADASTDEALAAGAASLGAARLPIAERLDRFDKAMASIPERPGPPVDASRDSIYD